MIGYGTLTVYNCPCLLSGAGTLTVNNNSVTMIGTATLYAFPSAPCTASAMIPALTSAGGNTAYAFSIQNIPALTSQADNNYVPPPPQYGYAMLPPFASFAITEEAAGTASAMLPSFFSFSGNCDYAYSEQTLPAFRSFGIYGYPDQMAMYSRATLTSIGSLVREQSMSMLSSMSLASYSVLTRIQVMSLLGSMSLTSYSVLSGEYILSLLGTMSLQGVSLFQVGTSPVLDETSRTWVVNLDTFATSQYDRYGFKKLTTDPLTGISYGWADDGIYELTGDTDNGEHIDALIDFGRSDLGSSQKKNVPCVYQGISSTGKMLLKVDADGQIYYYEARSSSTEMKNHRTDIGKRLVGNYWNFTMLNQNGCDFDLETIVFEPIPLSRKV